MLSAWLPGAAAGLTALLLLCGLVARPRWPWDVSRTTVQRGCLAKLYYMQAGKGDGQAPTGSVERKGATGSLSDSCIICFCSIHC